MKKLILAASFALIPFTAQADNFEKCEVISRMAEAIMEYRQEGGDMAALIQRLDEDLSVRLTKAAFKQPRYSSTKVQQRTIQDFKNEVFLECYK